MKTQWKVTITVVVISLFVGSAFFYLSYQDTQKISDKGFGVVPESDQPVRPEQQQKQPATDLENMRREEEAKRAEESYRRQLELERRQQQSQMQAEQRIKQQEIERKMREEYLRAEQEKKRMEEDPILQQRELERIRLAESQMIENKVDKILNAMASGTIAYNVPSNININDRPEIQLLLSLAETQEELKEAISAEGNKFGASIKVSDTMEAHLTGNMFQITPITPETQAISRGERTEWKWEISPKSEGKSKLHLTLSANIMINGKNTPRTIKTYEKFIEVEVTPQQKIGNFIKSEWKWLWAAILVPIVGWLWRYKKS